MLVVACIFGPCAKALPANSGAANNNNAVQTLDDRAAMSVAPPIGRMGTAAT
jgi:hypothetical protein